MTPVEVLQIPQKTMCGALGCLYTIQTESRKEWNKNHIMSGQ